MSRLNHQRTMQIKRDNQPTFFDLAMQQRGAGNKVLETIAREVDFSEAEQRVAATYSTTGRPACRVGVLLRVMILQHLYGLSDPQVEEQIKDRLSFQKSSWTPTKPCPMRPRSAVFASV
jgi:transposase, IS5 family